MSKVSGEWQFSDDGMLSFTVHSFLNFEQLERAFDAVVAEIQRIKREKHRCPVTKEPAPVDDFLAAEIMREAMLAFRVKLDEGYYAITIEQWRYVFDNLPPVDHAGAESRKIIMRAAATLREANK